VKKTLAHIAEWLHIEEKIDENPVITGVSINTRTIQPGDLFIPFRGEQVNGHRFVQDAFAKGARLIGLNCIQCSSELLDLIVKHRLKIWWQVCFRRISA